MNNGNNGFPGFNMNNDNGGFSGFNMNNGNGGFPGFNMNNGFNGIGFGGNMMRNSMFGGNGGGE